jgi:DNA-binding response OmpR family regulator
MAVLERSDAPPIGTPDETARILIAEDDPKHAELVRRFLEREGHSTTVLPDRRAALLQARGGAHALLGVGLMQPGEDGLDVCRMLRSERDTPIIMLTARASEDDLLRGLDLGADDYVTKPYSSRELVARVRSVLRRASRPSGAETGPYQVGDLTIDRARHEVRVQGSAVETTPAEFNILACLAASPGRVFTRQALLEHASEVGRAASGRSIDVHVMNLRRKVEPVPTRPLYLLTVYGVGYRLAESVDDEARGA